MQLSDCGCHDNSGKTDFSTRSAEKIKTSSHKPAKIFSGYAKTLGLNTATFDQCFTSGKFKQAVDDDLALAQSIGAGGTPTFYVNGQPLVGAQPFAAIDPALQ
jgi:protein-disulfide isomerase